MNTPLPLFPYQAEGAGYLAALERAGLFDEMGDLIELMLSWAATEGLPFSISTARKRSPHDR